MDFFNKLGKKATEAYKGAADKTGKIAKEAKIRMKIGELKAEINNIYEDIGKSIYENHVREEKQDIANELEEKCTKIDCLSDEIETCLKQCLELKDKRKCSKCYAEIEKDAKFCPKCGTEQENVEETAKEVEIVEDRRDEKTETTEATEKTEKEIKEESREEKSNLEKTVEVESDVDENHEDTVQYLEVEDETEEME